MTVVDVVVLVWEAGRVKRCQSATVWFNAQLFGGKQLASHTRTLAQTCRNYSKVIICRFDYDASEATRGASGSDRRGVRG